MRHRCVEDVDGGEDDGDGASMAMAVLGILNIITKSRLSSLNLVTVPKMPNLSLTPLKPSCQVNMGPWIKPT